MADVSEDRRGVVRLMTWNVHGSAGPDLHALARVVTDENPDVLALQEVRRGQASRLGHLLGGRERRWLLKHRPMPFVAARAEGLAVLSRFPIVTASGHVLSDGEPVRSFRRRVMQVIGIRVDREVITVANTHLSSDDDAHRAEQARRALAVLAGADVARTVLLGDLNTDVDDDVIGELDRAGLRDSWTDRYPDAAASARWTNPASSPTQRLDHVLVGSAYSVDRVRIPDANPAWAAMSDHLPVIADLRLG